MSKKVCEDQFLTVSEDGSELVDFEAAMQSEIKEIKSKKHLALAIRNDVKGVIFFKASSDIDVNTIFIKLIEIVKNQTWKPKYQASFPNSL